MLSAIAFWGGHMRNQNGNGALNLGLLKFKEKKTRRRKLKLVELLACIRKVTFNSHGTLN